MNTVIILCALVLGDSSTDDQTTVSYVADIKPILKERCYACHGGLKQESSLRLDTAALAVQGGDSGPAIVPGAADDSLLIEAVSGAADDWRMPPEGESLSEEQIRLLKVWIDGGAHFPEDEQAETNPLDHWSFRPPDRSRLPAVENRQWVRTPIDVFISARHQERGLVPVERADMATLLRRVFLNLTGLPPTRDQIHEFSTENRPDGFDRVVDRLLSSPGYGERWGRHWMDVWRYSDWYGRRVRGELRNSQRHIWRWRDWIVESLNENKGYHRMIQEMLAADELAPTDPKILRATGYLARNYNRTRNRWIEDAVEYTSTSIIGLTFRCTRCHDHKYDPLTQRDYYQMRAIFEPYNVRTDRIPGEADILQDGLPRAFDANLKTVTYVLPTGDPQQPDQTQPVQPGVPSFLGDRSFHVQEIELPPKAYYPSLREEIQQDDLRQYKQKVESAASQLAELPDTARPTERQIAQKQLASAEAEYASVQARIAADNARFGDAPKANTQRLADRAFTAERLARYRVAELNYFDAQHRLTTLEKNSNEESTPQAVVVARRTRDRAQQEMKKAQAEMKKPSGQYSTDGKVYPSTSSGRRLALARWITNRKHPLTARVAVNHIWMRHVGEPLVPSMSDFGRNGKPPTHPDLLDWLAVRFMDSDWNMKSLHRLIVTSASWQLRSNTTRVDQANRTIDSENVGLWRMNPRQMEAEVVRDSLLQVAGSLQRTMKGADLDPHEGEQVPRRSLYFRHAADGQMTFLEVFDVADPNECYRRHERVVPHQALAMANSNLTSNQSKRLAKRLDELSGKRLIDELFWRILCRPPTPEENSICLNFLESQARLDMSVELDAEQRRQLARQSLVHVIFNHNDFVTIW